MTNEQKHFIQHSWKTEKTINDVIKQGIEEAYEDDMYYYILAKGKKDETYMINKKTYEVRQSFISTYLGDVGISEDKGTAKLIEPPYDKAFNT